MRWGKGSTARRRERRASESREGMDREWAGKRGAMEARKGAETGARVLQWKMTWRASPRGEGGGQKGHSRWE